jgi:ACS family hexuronate transporter-like MFS transporter
MIAPPLVVFLHQFGGWQGAFLVTGGLGVVWVLLFQWFRFTHPQMQASDRAMIADTAPRVPWTKLIRYRQTWAVFFCRFLADPLWYFYVFWIPEFLTRERHMDMAAIGTVAWIPFLVSDISNFATGWVTLRLQDRGWSARRTRNTMMIAATIMSPVGLAAAFTNSVLWTMVFICISIFFWMAWSVTVHTLPGEFFPPRVVGTVYGFGGTGSTMGSVISTAAVGLVLDATHSYIPVFIGIGLLMPVALTVGMSLIGRGERVEITGA